MLFYTFGHQLDTFLCAAKNSAAETFLNWHYGVAGGLLKTQGREGRKGREGEVRGDDGMGDLGLRGEEALHNFL